MRLDKRALQIRVEDEIELQRPRRIAARWQCTGEIKKIATGHYRFSYVSKRAHLDLFIEDADQFQIRVCPAQMVLHYIYGMNVKKGQKTQGLDMEPPKPYFLGMQRLEKHRTPNSVSRCRWMQAPRIDCRTHPRVTRKTIWPTTL